MARRNPFEELDDLLDRLSEEFEEGTERLDVPVDVEDTGEAYEVHADLPGFEKSAVSVEVDGRTLRVRAERDEAASVTERYVRRERHHESVSRAVSLPGDVQADAATASFENGVLTVRLPKAGPNERRIKVE